MATSCYVSCCDEVILPVLIIGAFLEESVSYTVCLFPYLATKVFMECLLTLHSVMTSNNQYFLENVSGKFCIVYGNLFALFMSKVCVECLLTQRYYALELTVC